MWRQMCVSFSTLFDSGGTSVKTKELDHNHVGPGLVLDPRVDQEANRKESKASESVFSPSPHHIFIQLESKLKPQVWTLVLVRLESSRVQRSGFSFAKLCPKTLVLVLGLARTWGQSKPEPGPGTSSGHRWSSAVRFGSGLVSALALWLKI